MLRERPQAGSEAPHLETVLVDLARAESPERVVSTLTSAVQELAGADGCLLLSTDAERAASHPLAIAMIDRAGPLGGIVGAGRAVDLAAGDARAGALALPRGVDALRVVPCAGAGSTLALCVFWRSARPRGAELPGSLAAAAGMAIGRIEALHRERRGRDELQNRIRNVVATIRTVSTRSAERAESLPDYVLHFGGRLDAMARHHVASARAGDSGLEIEDLLRAELLAEGIQEGPGVVLKGVPARLARCDAEPLGLALHELAVNCVKFGPFSGRGGSLTVRWWSDTGPHGVTSRVEWREACELPAPGGPYRIGFGRHIVERALPYEVGAETDLAIGRYELCCSISVPPAAARN